MDADTESVVSCASDNESAEDITKEEKDRIKAEVSSMSFEDLQKLKQEIGAKVYNEAIFGIEQKPRNQFKRANKNRPREMSSKIRVKAKKSSSSLKKPVVRDPRFDPLCGNYDEKVFKSDYSFLKNLKKKERNQLEKEYHDTEDPSRKHKIKLLMQRLDNQIREREKREVIQTKSQTEKKEIRQKLKKGEKPIFKKKSEKKLDDLINQYEELRSNSQLQKHILRRSKKLASKEKKKNIV